MLTVKAKGIDKALAGMRDELLKERVKQSKTVAEVMAIDMAINTPVDTGYARSRWKSSVNGNSVVVSNDAPYIEDLNSGSSKQAPQFFVERTALKYGRLTGPVSVK
jgi:hypothetical protein